MQAPIQPFYIDDRKAANTKSDQRNDDVIRGHGSILVRQIPRSNNIEAETSWELFVGMPRRTAKKP